MALFFGKKEAGGKLPPQKELLSKIVRPGRKVDLILRTDLERDVIDVRHSVLHDVAKKGQLLLGQTFPRVPRSFVGQRIEATFLYRLEDRPGGRWIRLGYAAKVLSILEDYQLGPSFRETVLVLSPPAKLEQTTLRLYFRLSPSREKDLRLYLWPDRTKVELLDISAGGCRFMHPRIWRFPKGGEMGLLVVSGETEILVTGKVVRAGDAENERLGSSGMTAVQFVELSRASRSKLNKLLNQLARHSLAKRSGILERNRP